MKNKFSETKKRFCLNRPEQRSSLAFLTQSGMTFLDVEKLLKETTHTSYPVVVTRAQPYIVGQVQRRDLQIVLSMYIKEKTSYSILSELILLIYREQKQLKTCDDH
jgi:hypothetical protein